GMVPEFRQEGADTYVPIDQLFPQDKFHNCYELIVQTPDNSEVVGRGYLHSSQRKDVSFGILSRIIGQENVYHNSSPVWFDLLNDNNQPIVEGSIDLIFVKVSPWYNERDAQRQRVLYR
ncbi:MAG: hypothetical protein Q8R37_00210, partial [Nanoarchaeota archaeon]|nr:hypothetical protein [Nanoarchaeota archaeon]